MSQYANYPKFKAWRANGTTPASAYLLYTYESGTTTPKATYTTSALNVANANPIVLDANGEANIFLGSGAYRFDLKSPAGALIWTFDPIQGSGSFIDAVDTINDLKALSTQGKALAYVLGYHSAGDGGGGMFYYDTTASDADNGGTVITPTSNPATGRWKRLYSGAVSAKWFGAKGDGLNDETAELTAAEAYIESQGGGDLFFPEGTYLVSSGVTFGSASAKVKVIMEEHARFTSSGSVTLTFHSFQGSVTQHFAGSIVASFQPGAVGGHYLSQWWGAKGDGSTNDSTAIATAETAIRAAGGGTLFFPKATYVVGTNQTFGSAAAKVKVHMDEQAKFTAASTTTLTFLSFQGARSQHFAGSVVAAFTGAACDHLIPQWWGALGDGSTDDAPAIQAMFNALPDYGRVVFPPPPTYYRLNSPLECANKQGAIMEFNAGADTAQPSYPQYPLKYHGAALAGFESPVIRLLGLARPRIYGLAVDANNLAEVGMWFAGVNAYDDIPTLTIDTSYDTIDTSADSIINLEDVGGTPTAQTHNFATGEKVRYSNGGGTSIGGLTTGVDYFVIRVSATEFKLATTYANAIAGVAVDLTSTGSGASHTFTWQTKTTTTEYRRLIGAHFFSFASKNCTVTGAVIGQENQVNSSQTDLTTFHNSYFGVAESATQLALDAVPVTYGCKVLGTNTYVNLEHCEFTGDYGIYGQSGSVYATRPYFLGDAGVYVNSNTFDLTLIQPYGEGFMGRPIWTADGDNTEAKNINIIGAKFFPGGKATATIDSVADVDPGTDTITVTGHPYVTGDILIYSNGGGTSIAGLTTGGKYWCIRTGANTFKLASSLANAQAGTPVDITADGVGVAHTFTWRPAPMRFQSNQNVTMLGCFAEDFITDNRGSTGQKPVYTDIGNVWLHPTDYSQSPEIRLIRFSTSAGAAATEWLRSITGLLTQTSDYSSGGSTIPEGWSNVDIIGVQGGSGAATTLPQAKRGMGLRVWKLGTGALTLNKAASGGNIIRHDNDATAASSVRAPLGTENGFIQLTCLEDGEWRVSSTMTLTYDGAVADYMAYTGTWDPPNIVADAITGVTVTVPGVRAGDVCQASHDQIGGNAAFIFAQVLGDDSVRVNILNKTGADFDCASGTLRVKATRIP